MSASPREPLAIRRTTRIMSVMASSSAPSHCAYDSTRAVTSGGMGTSSISFSSIACTMRRRNARSRSRIDSANSGGPSGSSVATSSCTPVIESISALITARWTGVRPPSGAGAVAKARAIVTTSSCVGGSRLVSATEAGSGTGVIGAVIPAPNPWRGRRIPGDRERVTRIELASSDWKSEALPLSYTRVPGRGGGT